MSWSRQLLGRGGAALARSIASSVASQPATSAIRAAARTASGCSSLMMASGGSPALSSVAQHNSFALRSLPALSTFASSALARQGPKQAPAPEPVGNPMASCCSSSGTQVQASAGQISLDAAGEGDEDEDNVPCLLQRKRRPPDKLAAQLAWPECSSDKSWLLNSIKTPPLGPAGALPLMARSFHTSWSTASASPAVQVPAVASVAAASGIRTLSAAGVGAGSAADGEDGEPTVGGRGKDEEQFYLLTRKERHQRALKPAVRAWLWGRSEEMAAGRTLARVRIGKSGLTRAFLCAVGDQLQAHELVRVDVPKELDPHYVGWLLESTQDCAVVKAKGRTVTVFRDAALSRPSATLRDAIVGESERAAMAWGELKPKTGKGTPAAATTVAASLASTSSSAGAEQPMQRASVELGSLPALAEVAAAAQEHEKDEGHPADQEGGKHPLGAVQPQEQVKAGQELLAGDALQSISQPSSRCRRLRLPAPDLRMFRLRLA